MMSQDDVIGRYKERTQTSLVQDIGRAEQHRIVTRLHVRTTHARTNKQILQRSKDL